MQNNVIEIDLNFQKGSDLHNYQTRGTEQLRTPSIPKSKKFGTNGIMFKNIEIYNSLPEYIKKFKYHKMEKDVNQL